MLAARIALALALIVTGTPALAQDGIIVPGSRSVSDAAEGPGARPVVASHGLATVPSSDTGGWQAGPVAAPRDPVTGLVTPSPSPASRLRWSLVGEVAGSSIYDDEGSLGKGPGFSGAVAWAWSPRSALELTVGHATHARDTTGFRWESAPTVVTVRAVREFGASRVRPFVAGGLGVMHVSGTTEYRRWDGPLGGPPVTERVEPWRSTSLAFDLAAGASVQAGERLFIRPEFRVLAGRPDRDRFAPEPPYSMMHVGVGIGYRF